MDKGVRLSLSSKPFLLLILGFSAADADGLAEGFTGICGESLSWKEKVQYVSWMEDRAFEAE